MGIAGTRGRGGNRHSAVILALLDKGVDVLWRQSGGSRAIRLNASGEMECSRSPRMSAPEIIGSEGERLLRAERLYRSGTALARGPGGTTKGLNE